MQQRGSQDSYRILRFFGPKKCKGSKKIRGNIGIRTLVCRFRVCRADQLHHIAKASRFRRCRARHREVYVQTCSDGRRTIRGGPSRPRLGARLVPAHMHKLQSAFLVPDVTSIILNKIEKLRTSAETLPQETCLAETGMVSSATDLAGSFCIT